ncbi:MAG: hypothetical protein HQK77_00415 [Desulfobacterales bacterium]|nr:hypothetical protein [Desulfobacterales bacterium]
MKKLIHIKILPLLIVILSIMATTGAGTSYGEGVHSLNFHWRNPLPTGNSLRAITHAINKFVAVGEYGTIITSADGITWVNQISGTSDTLNEVTYANNLFVAVGGDYDRGTIVTSPDGITWNQQISGISDILNEVTYANNLFVAVGGDYGRGTIVTSPDGITWTEQIQKSGSLFELIYTNRQFVAIGGYSGKYGSFGMISTSPDGITWSDRFNTSAVLYKISYVNNCFVVLGLRYVPSTSSSVGVYTSIIVTSFDGITWNEQIFGTSKLLYGITYCNNKFVAVGESGTIATSQDGITWTEKTSVTSNSLNEIIYANNHLVAIGRQGTIVTSPDGIIWTNQTSGTTNSLSAITYENGSFVIVGEGGTILQANVINTDISPNPQCKSHSNLCLLTPPGTYDDVLENGDYFNPSTNWYFDVFGFYFNGELIIDAFSTKFSPFVWLWQMDQKSWTPVKYFFNQLQNSHLYLNLPNGAYWLIVSSFTPLATGDYTISIKKK